MQWIGRSDEELMAAVAAREEAALGALYDRHARSVYTLAMRITRDPGVAEEITQEIFLRVWRSAGQYSADRGRFANWLLRMTHHLAIDQLRRRQARPAVVASTDDRQILGIPDGAINVEEEAWLNARRAMVTTALEQLPDAQRRVIELAYFGGLTHVEIAARLGDPLGTVKTRLRLGLLKLRDLLRIPATELGAR